MDLNTVMLAVLLIGVLTVIVCIFGLISDGRKHKQEHREYRRKNLSENTAKTILSYSARQQSEAMYYRRRA